MQSNALRNFAKFPIMPYYSGHRKTWSRGLKKTKHPRKIGRWILLWGLSVLAAFFLGAMC
jgi:hypothetical protein